MRMNQPLLFDYGYARTSDPITSKIAAAMAQENKTPSQKAVWDVMIDGVSRTDEMIEAEAMRHGCMLSGTRLRHGRRELVQSGVLSLTKLTWKTKRGSPATVFVRADKAISVGELAT